MRPLDKFNFDIYLSYYDYQQFFDKGNILKEQPVWSENGLTYDYEQGNKRNHNLTIPVSDELRLNKTLYLHMQVTTPNPFYRKGINDKDYTSEDGDDPSKFRIKHIVQPPYLKFNETLPLIKYMPKDKTPIKRNLFDDSPVLEKKQESETNSTDDGVF